MKRDNQHNAFTLVELLVVIGIIAVLIGLLMPALGAARASARSMACLSNARTIAMVMDMYAQDDPNNFYPTARMPMSATGKPTWLDLTKPYVDELNVYRCPSDESEHWDAGTMPRLTSYGINAYFTPNHPPYSGIAPAEIAHPSETVIAAELVERMVDGTPMGADHFMPMYWGDPPAVSNTMMQDKQWDATRGRPKTIDHTRHPGENANYVFTDGHAGTLEFDATWRQQSGSAPSVDWYDPK